MSADEANEDTAADDSPSAAPAESSASLLTASVLDGEADRLAAQAEEQDAPVFADDLLPGVGAEEITLKQGLAKGGISTFVVLMILNSLDELEAATINVLGPDIAETFGVSNGTIVFLSSASAAFVVLGAMPMGWLADRYKRPPIIGWASAVFGLMVFLSGFAVNAFSLFWTRFGVGVAKANTLPVHGSLIADTYPIGVRGRIGSTTALAGRAVGTISPLLVGGIAILGGGVAGDGWRWAYLVLGVPVAIAAFFAFRLPEPPRGQWEKADVVGEVVDDDDPAPISVEAAFARLMRIRTVKSVLVAFSAIGFMIFPMASLTNFFLEDAYGLDSLQRGFVASASGLAVLAVLPFVGKRFDSLYRTDPSRALRLVGLLVLPSAVLVPVQFAMPNAVLFAIFATPNVVLTGVAFSLISPVMQAVVPYRLRGLGVALSTLYIFLFGAVGGALTSAVLTNALGERSTVTILAVPASIIGGLLIIRGSHFIRGDLSLVTAELREEQAEHVRQLEAPDDIPVVAVSEVDFSYGTVQVLFDVSFEVARGETLALLGTNGAGKSTILKVLAGLGTPSRGIVRLNGRNITFTSPEQRAAMGVQLLPGGRGVFAPMTVLENLQVGAHVLGSELGAERIDAVMERFPILAERSGTRAGALSGGQQQMLALGRVMLHQPEVLIIDELSLGLAPAVVQELLETIEGLQAEGQTMIIVEQSLNIAAAVAERAVFLEKGQVRFTGDTRDLLERDDLARAVFLGTEGG